LRPWVLSLAQQIIMEIIITTLIIIINMALTKAEPLNFIGNPNQRRCMAKLVTDSKLMGEADFPEIIGLQN
jgi:hypothetical protein